MKYLECNLGKIALQRLCRGSAEVTAAKHMMTTRRKTLSGMSVFD